MSAWRIVARSLYAIGGVGHASEFASGASADRSALRRLHALGLIENNGLHGASCVWNLTPLGWSWCQGKVSEVGGRHCNKTRFAASWLAALPTGVRIAAPIQMRESA